MPTDKRLSGGEEGVVRWYSDKYGTVRDRDSNVGLLSSEIVARLNAFEATTAALKDARTQIKIWISAHGDMVGALHLLVAKIDAALKLAEEG